MFAAAGRTRSAGRITMDDMEKAERSSDKLAKVNDRVVFWTLQQAKDPDVES